MKRRTKIVCTLGPATATKEKIHELIAAGMNVARINCSHGTWEERAQLIKWIREACADIAPVGILVDLQGPKFRVGILPVEGLLIKTGDVVTIGVDAESQIPLFRDAVYAAMKAGDRVLLGDGEIELKVTEQVGEHFKAKVISGGLVKSKKGITLVGKSFDSPCITDRDQNDIVEAAKNGADFIALSYVRSAADMKELRFRVSQLDPTIKLCAKIETPEAVKDLDEIIHQSDLIMVARGDLGLQMDIEEVPVVQKKIIDRCFHAGRPVITATQMLESMMNASRPTRAEASDVANAIWDGTDAVMLSGETAAGQYPIEAVNVMSRIAVKAEKMLDFEDRLHDAKKASGVDDETDEVGRAAVQLAANLGVKAIVTTSTTGTTPRLVSRFRPSVPIYCACWQAKTQAFLSVVWGVEAAITPLPTSTEAAIAQAVDPFHRSKRLKSGDKIIVTAGVPAGTPGSTNLILVQKV